MTDERPADSPDHADDPKAETNQAPGTAPGGGGTGPASSDPSGGWDSFDPNAPGPGPAGSESGSTMLSQLQSMIDSIATQAAPMAKQIGAKAAELTAVAADRAGPMAHRAGDAAADASGKLAQRSRELAADLRRELAGSDNGASHDGPDASASGGSSTATAVMDRPDDVPRPETATDEPPSEPAPGPG